MGGKAYVNPLFLVSFLVISISLFSNNTSAASCCITGGIQNGTCNPISSAPYTYSYNESKADCEYNNGHVYDSSCGIFSTCDSGCCCGTNPSFIKQGECTNTIGSPIFINLKGQSSADCQTLCSGGTSLSSCSNTNCGSVNSADCICGDKILSGGGFCCAANPSKVALTQDACKTSSACTGYTYYSISGKVIDDSTGAIVPYAIISASGQVTTSKNDGSYSLTGLLSGQINITVTKDKSTSKTPYNLNSNVPNYNLHITILSFQTLENCTYASRNIDSDGNSCKAMYDNACNDTSFYVNESKQNKCKNLADDDCDGKIDCADPDCAGTTACLSTHARCGDGNLDVPNYFGFSEECDGVNYHCPTEQSCKDCKCVYDNQVCGDGFITGTEKCDTNTSITPSNPLWKCSSTQSCDAITCQCVSQNLNCGNNKTESSKNEECDFTNMTGVALASGSSCTLEQCIKPGFAGACTCKTNIKCGNFNLDIGSDECDIDSSGNQLGCNPGIPCNFATCQCNTCSIDSKTPVLTNTSNSTHITLNWSVTCDQKPLNIIINSCEILQGETDCSPKTYKQLGGTVISDSVLKKDSCFNVISVYDLERYVSDKVCTNQSVNQCEYEGKYCDGTSLVSCDGNHQKTVDKCDDKGNICINHAGEAYCVKQSPCDLCNGVFGMFSSTQHSILEFEGTAFERTAVCEAALTCYFDYSNTSVDKYNKCEDVISCYDYNSEYACNINKCKVDILTTGDISCEWKNSTKFGELGIGVCRPVELEKQNCRICNQDPSNYFYGECDKSLCNLYGDACYFKDAMNCMNSWEVTCDDYLSQNDCTGGFNSLVDVTWNYNFIGNNINPFGGTNNHTVLSKDALNFTYCRWNDSYSSPPKCFKDGNGDELRDCDSYSLDSNAIFNCKKDFNPPQTNLVYNEPLKKDLSLQAIVHDDKSNLSTEFKYFYFNITPLNVPCYPAKKRDATIKFNSTTFSKTIIYDLVTTDGVTANNNGVYNFCYFSEDAHDNFEILRNVKLKIDTKNPEVNVTLINDTYETPVYPFREEDYLWVSDLNITTRFNDSTENGTCTLWLSSNEETYVGGIKLSNNLNLNTGVTIQYKALNDTDYTFHTECVDSAGNINENNKTYFKLDADQTITNIKPSYTFYGPNNEDPITGKITVPLEADTLSKAECRFTLNSNIANKDNFIQMTLFNNTNTTHHTHNLINHYDSANEGIKKVFVMCKYAINNRVYGNTGDYSIFAIDYTPPKTKIIDSNGESFMFDTSNPPKWYRQDELSDLKLVCQDEPMRVNPLDTTSRDLSSGCVNINYTLNSNNYDAPFNSSKSPNFEDVGNNETTLTFQGIDAVGNKETLDASTVRIDDEPYTFEFKIYKEKAGSYSPVTEVTIGTYQVEIIASKKNPIYDSAYMINIGEVGFKLEGDSDQDISQDISPILQDIGEKSSSEFRFRWLATMYISPSIKGEFYIKSIDTHGISSDIIVEPKTFIIDTSPAQAPLLDPVFENIPGSFGDIALYGDFFHSLNASYNVNNVYYTKDKELFVTGTSGEGVVDFYQNNMNNVYDTYNQFENAADTPSSGTFTLSQAAIKGDTNLYFNQEQATAFTNKYIFIEGFPRKEYKHYNEYYKVTESKNFDSGSIKKTNVTISPPLEEDYLSVGQPIKIYDNKYPHNWFGVQLNLSLGVINTFYAEFINDVGNVGSLNTYKIYFDNSTPYITRVDPPDGLRFGNTKPSIMVYLKDSMSGLDLSPSATILKLNGVKKDFNIIDNYTQSSQLHDYTLNFTTDEALAKGDYNVSFETIDLSRNKKSINWSFYVDPDLPNEPYFMLEGLNESENYAEDLNIWFTNAVRNFTLNYSDIPQVNISNINLYNYTGNCNDPDSLSLSARNAANCSRTVGNNFYCTFNNPALIEPDNNYYMIKINASKYVDLGTLTGISSKCFAMDTVTPTFTLNYAHRIKSGDNIDFTANVNNELKLKAYIEIENELLKTELEPTVGYTPESGTVYLYGQPFTFTWESLGDILSQNYDFTFYLKDLAGNEYSSVYTITIDNDPPKLLIKNITTTAVYITTAGITPHKINKITEVKNIHDENVMFRGTALNILGDVSEDIESINLSKMNASGDLIAGGTIELANNCPGTTGKGCFENGNFNVSNYLIASLTDQEIPYYLLFEIKDEAQNTAKYAIHLVSDSLAPNATTIQIIENTIN